MKFQNSQKHSMVTKSRPGGVACGIGREELAAEAPGEQGRVMEMFQKLTQVVAPTLSKTQAVHPQWVHFTVYKLHVIHLFFKVKQFANKPDV